MRSEGMLRDVSDEVFQRISCCMVMHRFPSGHRLFIEGNPAVQMASLRSGVVKISKLAKNGRTQISGIAGPGHVLGLEMLAGRPYGSTVETLTSVEVCMCDLEPLRRQVQEHPDVALGLAGLLCDRIAELETLVLGLGTSSTRARVAAHLLAFHRTPDDASAAGGGLELSRQDLADCLGMAKETLIRQLSAFAKARLIALRGGEIRLLDPDALERIAVAG